MISPTEIAVHAPKMVLLEGKQAVMANCSASAVLAKRRAGAIPPQNDGTTHLMPTAGLDPNSPGAPQVPESIWQQGDLGQTDPSGDADGDGFANQHDHQPFTPYKGPTIGPMDPNGDADGDGIRNEHDNEPLMPHEGPTIGPMDPTGDADGDGVINDIDNAPLDPNDATENLDKDNDGIIDWFDQNPNQPDFSADPDYGGYDDWDGDGIPNYQDDSPGMPEPDEVPPAWQNNDD